MPLLSQIWNTRDEKAKELKKTSWRAFVLGFGGGRQGVVFNGVPFERENCFVVILPRRPEGGFQFLLPTGLSPAGSDGCFVVTTIGYSLGLQYLNAIKAYPVTKLGSASIQ